MKELEALVCRAFTGAWIETQFLAFVQDENNVAPSQARGLKQERANEKQMAFQVAPSQARGLKPVSGLVISLLSMSRLHRRVD